MVAQSDAVSSKGTSVRSRAASTSSARAKDPDVTDTVSFVKALCQHTVKAAEMSRMVEAELQQLRAENAALRMELSEEDGDHQAFPGSTLRFSAASSLNEKSSRTTTAGQPQPTRLNGKTQTEKSRKQSEQSASGTENLKGPHAAASALAKNGTVAWTGPPDANDDDEKPMLTRRRSRTSLTELMERYQQTALHQKTRQDQLKRHLLFDPERIKNRLRDAIAKPQYDVTIYYSKEGCAQAVARHQLFENVTLSLILLNAIWIAVDTQHNRAEVLLDAPWFFQVPEHIFCTYFFVELVFRFLAFKSKRDCMKDLWFICDFVLMVSMVTETWIVTFALLVIGGADGGDYLGVIKNASLVRMLRVLRITRLARAVKLLRVAPEVMVMLKAVMSSMRCVCWTFTLLLCIVFFFGVAFTQMCRDTSIEKPYFVNLTTSMHTLLMAGVFPDLGAMSLEIANEHFAYWLFWMVFLLLTSLAVLNLLVGVLVEIVKSSSNIERDAMDVAYTRQMFLEQMGLTEASDFSDVYLTKVEFAEVLQEESIIKALLKLGIDVLGLFDLIDWIFISGDRALTELLEVILQLRSSATVTVRDIVDLRKFLTFEINKMQSDAHDLFDMMNQINTTRPSVLSRLDSKLDDKLAENPVMEHCSTDVKPRHTILE